MICCDGCEEWFHGKCVGITMEQGRQMEKNGQEYVCTKCKGEHKVNLGRGGKLEIGEKSTLRPNQDRSHICGICDQSTDDVSWLDKDSWVRLSSNDFTLHFLQQVSVGS